MTTETQQAPGAAPATAEAPTSNLLDQIVQSTRQTTRDEAVDYVKALVDEAVKKGGSVRFDKTMVATLKRAITVMDAKLSEQLAAVMHHEKFLKLEGSWRGLRYLVLNSETGPMMQIRMLSARKEELKRDLDNAIEFDQSWLYKQVYEEEFGKPGGKPYSTLVGDYEFGPHPEDVDFLGKISSVAASAFAPFIAAASPEMFGLQSFTELPDIRDIATGFQSKKYIAWRSFRDSEDSRFVTLAMPRVLARMPFGRETKPIEEFGYEEIPRKDLAGQPMRGDGAKDALAHGAGERGSLPHSQYCWMSAAYVLAARLTDAFAQYGWCVAIRGAEGGGKVTGLPTHVFPSDRGDLDQKCPTEVAITDRREKELSDCGFLPLCHYKDTDYAVFFGAQTAQKPKAYGKDTAGTENAAISARLPYIMATARIAHYLKVIARDKIGSFMEREDCERFLNRWVGEYVNENPDAGPEMKARYPLREARVQVQSIPGKPGSYRAVAYLRPWLQLEELTTSLRLVADIPKQG